MHDDESGRDYQSHRLLRILAERLNERGIQTSELKHGNEVIEIAAMNPRDPDRSGRVVIGYEGYLVWECWTDFKSDSEAVAAAEIVHALLTGNRAGRHAGTEGFRVMGAGKERLGSNQELGTWLRQQRESRSWARLEMARQLIKAARSNGDLSLPGIDSLMHNIYRWERGTCGPTDRYKLHYCHALGISPDDFGADHAERPLNRTSVSSGDPSRGINGLLDDLRGIFREWRETLAAAGIQIPATVLETRPASEEA